MPDPRDKRPRGRPSVGANGTEVVNFLVDVLVMDQVRAHLAALGAGATIAGWMRDAIAEKLARETHTRIPLGDPRGAQGHMQRTQPNYPQPLGTPDVPFTE